MEKKHKKSEIEIKCEEYLNNWKRERANFINYKKDEGERMKEMVAYINSAVVLNILPILDNFDMAEKNLSDKEREDKNIKGMLMIKKQIVDFLKTLEVTQIEALGKEFDPNFHEAVEEEFKEGIDPGIVTEEILKGYLINNKVLRATKVKISK